MSPVTHFLAGWAVANAAGLAKRDRWLVTLAGIAPDADGMGVVAEVLTRESAHPLLWWTNYHHVFGHSLIFGVCCAVGACFFATRKSLVVGLVLASFHLHLLGDVLGGRGPDGYIWTVPYFWPFSDAWVWSWQGQWKLNSWQNLVLTSGLLALTFRWAWQKGFSPLELFPQNVDLIFIETLRRRFPLP